MCLFVIIPLISLVLCFGENQDGSESQCFQSCPTSWERFEERCYFWSDNEKKQADAEKFCKEKGAHLASVTNQNIHNYIWNKAQRTGEPVWLGGTDLEQEGMWTWNDGSAWNFTFWATHRSQLAGPSARQVSNWAGLSYDL